MTSIKNHIIVTGMHRSGTSYLVRALNLCGLNLGPESDFFDTELQPKFGNPRGHWENVKVTNLNEQILKLNGGSWHKVPNSFIKTPKNLQNKINQILKSFYSEKSLAYGFKDPRFCLTLPKWKKNLPNLVLIGVFRHPLKVAESLKKRDGFSYEESIEIWKKYNESLLHLLKNNKAFLINFDWPRKKLLAETQIICSNLGLAEIDVSNWYSDSHKKSDKSFTKSHKLNPEILEIYRKLKLIAEKNNSIKYKAPKINDKQYQMIVSDLLRHSNTLYSDTVRVFQKNFEEQRKKDYQFLEKSPLGTLLSIYFQRNDLQKKFPKVVEGDLIDLIEWAKNISSNPDKGEIVTKKQISKHSLWFSKYLTNEQNRIGLSIQEKTNLTNEIDKYKKNIDVFQQEKTNLTNEIDKYKKSIDVFQQEKTNLTNENEQNKKEIESRHHERTNLLNEIEKYKKSVDSLKFELSKTKQEIEAIKSSRSHKIVRFLGSKTEKISRKKKVLKDIKSTISVSKKIIETEGVRTFVERARERKQRGEFLLHSANLEKIPIQIPSDKPKVITDEILNKKEIIDQKFCASVVILSNSDENSLLPLIEKINSQKGLKTLQIILVNSGINDLSTLERFPNTKCVRIKPQKFNHGQTRNLGANESNGDFIIFLTDDAIPASNQLFYDMCNVFSKDNKISVVTARQIPRSDSDLMSTFSLNEYYEHLDLTEDRIISTKDFDNLDSAEKRRTSQIDDVCSCYRRQILSKYPFGELKYAEDLDMGIRLIKDGYKIAQLFSTGVIHSHKRTAEYYVRRHFVETKVLSSLLDYHLLDFKKYEITSSQDLFNHIFTLYNALNHTIDLLKERNTLEIREAFDLITNELKNFYPSNSKANSMEPSLEKLFKNFNKNIVQIREDSFLLKDYLGSLDRLKNYLMKSFPNLKGLEVEFFETLYKIFGVIIGNRLGGFVLFSRKYNLESKDLDELDNALESDV